MPLLFKQRNNHHRPPRFGTKLPSSGTLNNVDESSVHSGPTISYRIAKRLPSQVASSFSSERTGNFIRQFYRKVVYYAKNPQKLLPLFKKYYKNWHLKHIIPLVFVMIYMVVGAIIFLWLEESSETKRILIRSDKVQRERNLFIKRIDEILYDQAAITQYGTRRKFVEEALDYFHKELKVDIYYDANNPKWSFTTAMYYSGTIFTTIGYGDVYCTTLSGRILTIIYAIVGIPMMLITLNHLGKFLYKWINTIVALLTSLLSKICRKICPTRKQKISRDENKANSLSKQSTKEGLMIPTTQNADEALIELGTEQQRVNFILHNGEEEEEELPLDMNAFNDPEFAKKISISPPPSILATKSKQVSQESGLLSTNTNPKLDKVDVESGIELVNDQNDDEFELLPDQEPMPRMPVTVALTCTIGWIFICAALFKFWEKNWTYAESLYFMFISLSTIGLGDVSVERRDLMVVCFVFVIIGLSLVSMCINVIQLALEDLYRKLLMKILLDYQAKLAEGGNAHSASIGMMKMWGDSKTAKYLMPMLSADTRRAVMQKVQEDAKETGIEIPPIFEEMDDKTGMPKILAAVETKDIESQAAFIEELVKNSNTVCRSPSVPSGFVTTVSVAISGAPEIICYENCTQTDQIFCEEKNIETTRINVDELAIQTDSTTFGNWNFQTLATQTSLNNELTDGSAQTQLISEYLEEKETQTFDNNETITEVNPIETNDAETMTIVSPLINIDIQTEKVFSMDEQLQTHLYDLMNVELQTQAIEEADEYIQTSDLETIESEAQTDDLQDPTKTKNISKIRKARKQLQKALNREGYVARRVSHGDHPTLTNWRDSVTDKYNDSSSSETDAIDEKGASSYESLNWDPVDGLHAEKQKPVKDLKKLFDSASRNRGTLGTAMGSGFSVPKKPNNDNNK